MRIPQIALVLCLFGSSAMAASSEDPFRDYAGLMGQWTCHGVFPASGKTIDSALRFESDLGGKALLKHHDDTTAPALYHAVEAWGYDAKAGRYSAAILDNFGGARIFSSAGWAGDTLLWTSAPEVKPAQRFRYVRLPTGGMRIDWEVEKQGAVVVGDTLNCERASDAQGRPSTAR
jgi:hypothetical protein